MEDIKKITYYNDLFDHYHPLLTKKQTAYFVMYFQKDYSLKEIADYYNISRNGVYDLIKVAIKKLEEYENQLKLLEKRNKRHEYYEEYQKTKNEKWLKKLMEVEDTYGV